MDGGSRDPNAGRDKALAGREASMDGKPGGNRVAGRVRPIVPGRGRGRVAPQARGRPAPSLFRPRPAPANGCRTNNRTEGMMGKLLAATALLALAGCATRGDIDRLRSDIAGLRAAVEQGNAATAPAAPDVAMGPPPTGYEPVSKLVNLPDFMPGLGALYVRPGSLPAGPFLAYDRDNRLVSTIYMVPVADIVARKRFEDLAVVDPDVRDVDLY